MAKKKTRWTRKRLIALGVPAVLIPGFLLAIVLGWNPTKLATTSDYHTIQTVFPKEGIVSQVRDGDTFALQNGVEVRMLGIDAPNRGAKSFSEATDVLTKRILGKRVYLEYDRYQDDKYGRILAWVWVGCEKEPTFLPNDYMRLSNNTSRPGLTDNPEGCKKGTLVNEAMVDAGWATGERYKDRGPLKYEERLGAR
jgi:endonuclease YncB( thermonuclease family)